MLWFDEYGGELDLDEVLEPAITIASVSFPHRVGNQILTHSGFQDKCLSELRSLGHDVVIGGMYGSSHVIVLD